MLWAAALVWWQSPCLRPLQWVPVPVAQQAYVKVAPTVVTHYPTGFVGVADRNVVVAHIYVAARRGLCCVQEEVGVHPQRRYRDAVGDRGMDLRGQHD